jgi:hypothetical protein
LWEGVKIDTFLYNNEWYATLFVVASFPSSSFVAQSQSLMMIIFACPLCCAGVTLGIILSIGSWCINYVTANLDAVSLQLVVLC